MLLPVPGVELRLEVRRHLHLDHEEAGTLLIDHGGISLRLAFAIQNWDALSFTRNTARAMRNPASMTSVNSRPTAAAWVI